MKDPQHLALASAIGLTVGFFALYSIWRRKKDREKWVEVATVDKLYVHPVKACRGVLVDSFTCTEQGVMLNGSEIGDRCFMLIHEGGRYVSIADVPRMVLIHPTVIGRDRLRLEAPGMEALELRIPQAKGKKLLEYKVFDAKCPGIDCGDQAAAWLQEFLKVKNPRLIFHDQRLPPRKRNKLIGYGHLGVYAKEPVKSVFHNCCAFNMVSQASLDLLNTKLDSEHQVTERFFRPNVLLSNCDAFAEDTWKRVKIGSAEFEFAKFTNRCPVTTVNPETGQKDENRSTLVALSSFRMCKPEETPIYGKLPRFCVDYVVTKEGKVHVGDSVFLYIGEKTE